MAASTARIVPATNAFDTEDAVPLNKVAMAIKPKGHRPKTPHVQRDAATHISKPRMPARVICTLKCSHNCKEQAFEQSTRIRKVAVGCRDSDVFAKEEPFSWVFPAGSELQIMTSVEFPEQGHVYCSVFSPLAMIRESRMMAAMLYDEDSLYAGRLMYEVTQTEGALDLRIKYVAQLDHPVTPTAVIPQPRTEILLAGLLVYIAFGLIVFRAYMKATLIDSFNFMMSLGTVSGLSDITHDAPEGDWNPDLVHLILIPYMLIAGAVVFTFLEEYYSVVVDEIIWPRIEALGIFAEDSDDVARFTEIARHRFSLYCLMVLYVGGAFFFSAYEKWSLIQSFYYSTSVMVTASFCEDTPQSFEAKCFLLCFVPAIQLHFFHIVRAYVDFKGLWKRNCVRKLALDDLIQRPEDFVDLLDENNQASKYEFFEYVLLKSQLVDEDDIATIRDWFDSLDTTGHGILRCDDLKVRRSSESLEAVVLEQG
eukprot:TRINITY_DN30424_c0_g1_i1.p1 TRINITY_DN30424_c0_g1~~TRINITY_DN30424_c0_g1_i1.p1  ORF type:complete len:480 (-),score=63.16 TRINITY_DN30424_c0_g1_i1:59-1498(-)